jgi:hypothetical protein
MRSFYDIFTFVSLGGAFSYPVILFSILGGGIAGRGKLIIIIFIVISFMPCLVGQLLA